MNSFSGSTMWIYTWQQRFLNPFLEDTSTQGHSVAFNTSAAILLLFIITTTLWILYSIRHRRILIPDPSVELSWQAADNRRAALQAFLREFAPNRAASKEFIESPPTLAERFAPLIRTFQDDDDDNDTSVWHTARLLLQLDEDRSLLIERVIDAIVSLERLKIISRRVFPTSIYLEGVSNQKTFRYPWRVVLTADQPAHLHRALKQPFLDMGDWLGIGVDIIRSKSVIKPLGTCRIVDDTGAQTEGIVGGFVRDGEQIYGVTCRHVLSMKCHSLRWPQQVRPRNMEFTDASPDAAFIRLDSGCFVLPGTPSRYVSAASEYQLETLYKNKIKLLKFPVRDNIPGRIKKLRGYGFLMEGPDGKSYFYRGRHVEIKTAEYTKYWLTWPHWPFRTKFSISGDSGSWVLAVEEPVVPSWIGMIVGGSKDESYAISGSVLIEAFRLFSRTHPGVQSEVFLTDG